VTVTDINSGRKCLSDDTISGSGYAVASMVYCSCKFVDAFPPWASRFPCSEAPGVCQIEVVVSWGQDSSDTAGSEDIGNGELVSEEHVATVVETMRYMADVAGRSRFVRCRGRAIEAKACTVSSRRRLHVPFGTQKNSSSDLIFLRCSSGFHH
jgi:hypothetical protein